MLRNGSIALWAWLKPADFAGDGRRLDILAAVNGSASIPATASNTNGNTTLARFIEAAVENIIEEISMWEQGGGVRDEADFDEEGIILPGLNMMMHEAFKRITGRPRQRSGIEMDIMVLSAIKESG